MAKDKRQHPRVEISWPATIITDDGLVSCRTENLSPEGTLIRCSESPGPLDNFRLVFKPAERQLILATAEKVWSKSFNSNNSPSHAMGVRFTFIPDHDYQLIKGTVSQHTRREEMADQGKPLPPKTTLCHSERSKESLRTHSL